MFHKLHRWQRRSSGADLRCCHCFSGVLSWHSLCTLPFCARLQVSISKMERVPAYTECTALRSGDLHFQASSPPRRQASSECMHTVRVPLQAFARFRSPLVKVWPPARAKGFGIHSRSKR
nr:MAG TPA: hypothetical protein [Inoviridae sp.]